MILKLVEYLEFMGYPDDVINKARVDSGFREWVHWYLKTTWDRNPIPKIERKCRSWNKKCRNWR